MVNPWEHAIVVDEVISGALSDPFRFLAGARSAPPQDLSGVSRYAGLVEALADPYQCMEGIEYGY